MVAEALHGTLQVPEAKGCLAHLQDGGSVERCRSIGRLLGVEPELQVEKAAQALIAAAAAESLKIGNGEKTERGCGEIAGCECVERSAQIPA